MTLSFRSGLALILKGEHHKVWHVHKQQQCSWIVHQLSIPSNTAPLLIVVHGPVVYSLNPQGWESLQPVWQSKTACIRQPKFFTCTPPPSPKHDIQLERHVLEPIAWATGGASTPPCLLNESNSHCQHNQNGRGKQGRQPLSSVVHCRRL